MSKIKYYQISNKDPEFSQVLELRKKAYAKSNRIAEDFPAENTQDKYDEIATIFIAKDGDKVIATLRGIPYKDSSHEEDIFPGKLPSPSECYGSSKYAVDYNYRSTDVGIKIATFMIEDIARHHRKYFVMTAYKDLLKMYNNRFGVPYSGVHSSSVIYGKDTDSYLMLGEVRKFYNGDYLNFMQWSIGFRNATLEAVRYGHFDFTLKEKFIIHFKSLFYPVAVLLFNGIMTYKKITRRKRK